MFSNKDCPSICTVRQITIDEMSFNNTNFTYRRLVALATVTLSCFLAPVIALADTSTFGETQVEIKGGVTFGTAIRGGARDGALLPNANSSLIGVQGSAPSGQNQDDGNLNYGQANAVSTVLKGYLDLNARRDDFGLFARLKAWHDFTLANHGVPWGNEANGYAAGQPLGEDGFPRRARFSGMVLEDAYVRGNFRPLDRPLSIKLGRLTLPWGEGFTTGGGVAELNPADGPASRRPGAQAEESLIAFPAAFAQFEITDSASVDLFAQVGFEPSVLVPCGSFYSNLDYMSPGCDKVWVGGASDRDVTGYRTRASTPGVSDAGQYGLALGYRVQPWSTTFGMTASQYHSRIPYGSILKGNAPTTTQYFTEYPERIRLYAVQFTTRLPDTVLRGALTHRPNQPVQLNGADLILAFATPAPNALLRGDANAMAAGAAYPGYDRLATTQLQLAAASRRGGILGAVSTTFSGEWAIKQVHGLPDVGRRRYGRSEVFGAGAVSGVVCAGSTVTCSNDGYVTPTSWGYRLRVQLSYPKLLEGVDLKPSLTWGHDVRGWSADNTFSEGRKSATLSLRAEVAKRYFTELAWQASWGGTYDNLRDRDTLSLALGAAF
jgi:hypothetical protein